MDKSKKYLQAKICQTKNKIKGLQNRLKEVANLKNYRNGIFKSEDTTTEEIEKLEEQLASLEDQFENLE